MPHYYVKKPNDVVEFHKEMGEKIGFFFEALQGQNSCECVP